ncbi:MAG: ATP-binding protein [Roseivirga sp.]|nr:ATP-binding protein [Roseivirga sp.]
MSEKEQNMATLNRELHWFAQVLNARISGYLTQKELPVSDPPDLSQESSAYANLVRKHEFDEGARLVLILALAPHVMPAVLDPFFTKNSIYDRGMTEFGGYLSKNHGGFLPTGETAVFINSEGDFTKRAKAESYLHPDHPLVREELISLYGTEKDSPRMSAPLIFSERFLPHLLTGEAYTPQSYALFPAKKINTNMEWSDLVIDKGTLEDIDQIRYWIEKGDFLMNEMELDKKIKPGYRSLFYGPPGTGKTLTACLLGKATGSDVYRVDLSAIVSKYIGETEKNLSRIFDYAEKQGWILFFDEADALFGKRTQTSSSNDRFANQEVAYLLQRIEDFPGVVILASNLRSNIDQAFSRRFQSMVYFGMPDARNRYKLWQKIFEGPLKVEENLNLRALANDYEMSGGSAINVYRFGALKAMSRPDKLILKEDILKGIQKEFQKEGKTL